MVSMKGVAKDAEKWLETRVARMVRRIKRSRFLRRTGLATKLEGLPRLLRNRVLARVRPPRRRTVGDERALRRAAERQRGGMSSFEAAQAFANGELKGGTHGGKAVHFDGPEHQRPTLDEPGPRVARHPGGDGHMAERRSG
jgi:hypothetical protein